MDFTVFEDLLKQTMGLEASAIGPSAIERAVRERMTKCKQPDVRLYEEYLLASESELQQLIEAAVVPETWFFRDPKAFAEMARTVAAESLRVAPGHVMRLLSLPCSTGEEPYSMAMALLDAGLPPGRFRIDAADISARALAHARAAVYGRNSFRGDNLEFRERYFEVTAAGHRLSDAVRELVHFEQGNMLAADFLPQAGIYDVIFCRNLLVYFEQATQSRAIGIIHRLLSAAGVLFVGPAEAGMMFGYDFVWSKVPFAFAFRKGAESPVALARSVARLRRHENERATALPARARPVAFPKVAPIVKLRLDDAAELADLGRFAEAMELCREYVCRHDPSAPAFHLMALICSAAGNVDDAVQHLRKALYLDPKYDESLVHLALLLEKRGDTAGARQLRDRLRRLEPAKLKAAP